MSLKSVWLQFIHVAWRMWRVQRWTRKTQKKEDPQRRQSCKQLCPPEAGQREVRAHKMLNPETLLWKVSILFSFWKNINKDCSVFVPGQAKPSVSSRADESFVTPRKTRKSKKPVITFSSDEEEDEEGECHYLADSSICSLLKNSEKCPSCFPGVVTLDGLFWHPAAKQLSVIHSHVEAGKRNYSAFYFWLIEMV